MNSLQEYNNVEPVLYRTSSTRILKKVLLRDDNEEWKNYPGIQLCFRLFGTQNVDVLFSFKVFCKWVEVYFRHHQLNLHILERTTIPKAEELENLYTLTLLNSTINLDEMLGSPSHGLKTLFTESKAFIDLISSSIFNSSQYSFYYIERDEIFVWAQSHQSLFLKYAAESELFPSMVPLKSEFSEICFRPDLYTRSDFLTVSSSNVPQKIEDNYEDWSVDRVGEWLNSKNLDEFVTHFHDQDISGKNLEQLSTIQGIKFFQSCFSKRFSAGKLFNLQKTINSLVFSYKVSSLLMNSFKIL